MNPATKLAPEGDMVFVPLVLVAETGSGAGVVAEAARELGSFRLWQLDRLALRVKASSYADWAIFTDAKLIP